MMKYKIPLLLTFIGSMFIVSDKFVNSENTAKFYYTLIALLIFVFLFFIKGNNLQLKLIKVFSLQTLKCFFLMGAMQAIYGFLQYINIFHSNHYSFDVTGSFDNPAGFAAVLSLLIPIGIYWYFTSKGYVRYLMFLAVLVIFVSIILSGSRTGIVSCVCSMLIVPFVQYRLDTIIKRNIHCKLVLLVCVILLLGGCLLLYKWKENSANGRLLIWNVSSLMIQDKPIFGFGYKGFQANYMDYQSRYFKNYPQSKFSMLADNVKHPFNEFIQIAVNYGVISSFVCLVMLCYICWRILKSNHPQRSILISCIVTFIIFSFLSYPLQYITVWLILGSLLIFSINKSIIGENIQLVFRILIYIFCFVGIVFLIINMSNEMQWAAIAKKSLYGQTQKMLSEYEKLYSRMKHNELFLYNYSAELNFVKYYSESNKILNECTIKLNDFDVQMLLADNYLCLGDTVKAIEAYHYAGNMIPCRFMPLYKLFIIYKSLNQYNKAFEFALLIVDKEVKIRSATVYSMKAEAKHFLKEHEQQ